MNLIKPDGCIWIVLEFSWNEQKLINFSQYLLRDTKKIPSTILKMQIP